MRLVMMVMVTMVIVSLVIGMIIMGGMLTPAWLAVKDHEEEPKAVKRGHKYTQQQHVLDHLSRGLIREVHRLDDHVLGVKA